MIFVPLLKIFVTLSYVKSCTLLRTIYFSVTGSTAGNSRKISQKNNVRKTAPAKKTVQCAFCEKEFSVTLTPKEAEKQKHSSKKPSMCNVCWKKFLQHSNPPVIKPIHSDDSSFKCDFCQTTFSTNDLLLRHRQSHILKNSYVCGHCQKTFPTSIELYYHRRTHSGDRPFKCDRCDKSFAYKSYLVKHKELHFY